MLSSWRLSQQHVNIPSLWSSNCSHPELISFLYIFIFKATCDLDCNLQRDVEIAWCTAIINLEADSVPSQRLCASVHKLCFLHKKKEEAGRSGVIVRVWGLRERFTRRDRKKVLKTRHFKSEIMWQVQFGSEDRMERKTEQKEWTVREREKHLQQRESRMDDWTSRTAREREKRRDRWPAPIVYWLS